MTRALRTLGLGLMLAWLPTTSTVASDVDGLLDLMVKKRLITQEEADGLRKELAEKKQKEKAEQKSQPVTAKRPAKMTAYTHVRGLAPEGDNDSLLVRRARVGLEGEVSEGFGYKLLAEFGGESATADKKSVQKPLLLEAQALCRLGPDSVLQVGQFKVPFSYENLLSDTNLDLINRAMVVEKLVPARDIGSVGRDIGVEWDAKTKAGPHGRLDWSVGLFNGSGIDRSDDNDSKDLAGRVVFHPNPFASIGLSGYRGTSGPAEVLRDRWGAEFVYGRGSDFLKAEWVTGKDDQTPKQGWYALAGHRFAPKLEGVLRFETYDPDRHLADDATDAWTLGANYYFSDNVKLQLNYEAHLEEGDEVNNDALISQFQVRF